MGGGAPPRGDGGPAEDPGRLRPSPRPRPGPPRGGPGGTQGLTERRLFMAPASAPPRHHPATGTKKKRRARGPARGRHVIARYPLAPQRRGGGARQAASGRSIEIGPQLPRAPVNDWLPGTVTQIHSASTGRAQETSCLFSAGSSAPRKRSVTRKRKWLARWRRQQQWGKWRQVARSPRCACWCWAWPAPARPRSCRWGPHPPGWLGGAGPGGTWLGRDGKGRGVLVVRLPHPPSRAISPQRLVAHLHGQGAPPYVINLDPAVHELPFPANIGESCGGAGGAACGVGRNGRLHRARSDGPSQPRLAASPRTAALPVSREPW